MIRLLIFIAVLFVAALGSAWIADRPGLVTLDWQGYRIEVGLMTAAVALALLVAVCIALWNLLLFVLRSPGLLGRFFRDVCQAGWQGVWPDLLVGCLAIFS